jgi:hypothetical protein
MRSPTLAFVMRTGRKFTRLRILSSLGLGRLVRSPLYHELQVPEFEIACRERIFKLHYRVLPVDGGHGTYRRLRGW